MNFESGKTAALLAAIGLVAAPAQAATIVPSIETIETRMCPVGGAGALRLGQPEAAQDPALRRAFSGRNLAIAPFIESRAAYTVWSDKLSSVEFTGAHSDGNDDDAIAAGLITGLEASGWKRVENMFPRYTFFGSHSSYEKVLPTADGPRLMVLQFDASGGVMLRCGDPELIQLSADEELEKLAPGSPRPVPSAAAVEPIGMLRPEDCARPEVRENLDQTLNESADPKLSGASDEAFAQKRYQQRLHSWLHWKIIQSGKFDEGEMWKFEQKVDAESDLRPQHGIDSLLGYLVASGGKDATGNSEAKCRAAAKILAASAEDDVAEGKRLTRINTALEAAAKKRGIAVD